MSYFAFFFLVRFYVTDNVGRVMHVQCINKKFLEQINRSSNIILLTNVMKSPNQSKGFFYRKGTKDRQRNEFAICKAKLKC